MNAEPITIESEEPQPLIVRLARADAVRMAASLGAEDVRALVDLYYAIQEMRKATGNQRRAAIESAEPSEAIAWTLSQMIQAEAAIRRIMDAWTDRSRAGRWAKSQVGIGPVLTAGCLATFGAPKSTSEPGQRRAPRQLSEPHGEKTP